MSLGLGFKGVKGCLAGLSYGVICYLVLAAWRP